VRRGAPRRLGCAGRGAGVVCDVSPNPVPDISSTVNLLKIWHVECWKDILVIPRKTSRVARDRGM
jgi:hypothetical protein